MSPDQRGHSVDAFVALFEKNWPIFKGFDGDYGHSDEEINNLFEKLSLIFGLCIWISMPGGGCPKF